MRAGQLPTGATVSRPRSMCQHGPSLGVSPSCTVAGGYKFARRKLGSRASCINSGRSSGATISANSGMARCAASPRTQVSATECKSAESATTGESDCCGTTSSRHTRRGMVLSAYLIDPLFDSLATSACRASSGRAAKSCNHDRAVERPCKADGHRRIAKHRCRSSLSKRAQPSAVESSSRHKGTLSIAVLRLALLLWHMECAVATRTATPTLWDARRVGILPSCFLPKRIVHDCDAGRDNAGAT
mmetsp:Transcript_66030/g.123145  ORF Transcript_66030/g.123145 Transcript_66030/m.123145 type:complete len:245 (+) Transcript_66030:505-1239(+)